MITRILCLATLATLMAMIDTAPLSGASVGPSHFTTICAEVADRDKTGTNGCPTNENGSQVAVSSVLASRVSFRAEGKGLEPSTGYPAPDFESGC